MAQAQTAKSGAGRAAPAPALHPMIQIGMTYLLGLDEDRREEIVTKVCDTLAAYPRFWRTKDSEEDGEPEGVPCVVKTLSGNQTPSYAIAAFEGGEAQLWKSNGQTIVGVVAWAILPA